MVLLDFTDIQLKVQQQEGKTKVFDPIRKKWLILTPEEHVRQYLLVLLTDKMHYPAALVSVEKTILVSGMNKRFDIVVYNRNHEPWMLVECKSPDVAISEKTLHQLLTYQSKIQCPYWLMTNGHQAFCADARDVTQIKWVSALPEFESSTDNK